MRMGFGLNIEQTQKLIMTPELRQAITILQLSSLELENYIEQQLQENPLLEVKDDEAESPAEPVAETKKDDVETGEERYDIEWREYFSDSSDLGIPHDKRFREEKEEHNFESYVSQPSTLLDHLSFQLHLSDLNERELDIGEYIIGNIDENGYLQVSVEEIAEHLQVSPAEVTSVLKLVQTFDPPGVGARDLRECLLLQTRQMDGRDELVEKIISRHLEDVAKGKYVQLAQLLGVPVQEIQRAADFLKTLDPKPGRNFTSPGDNRYVVPDVVLQKVNGDYVILVNDTSVPRLTINSAYRAVLGDGNKHDTKTKRYVESKLNAAAWLIRSIEQRRLTLYKVASCLVELQRDFLDHGIKYLKPLNLKKVAEMVGLHESTVSRATSNKYIQTPQGVFEMKFFFSSGLGNAAGGMVSAQSIKKMLQELVESEDPAKPLNDQRIAEFFAEQGIKISRRTVAKYRDELGIPPVRKRKRY